MCLRVLELLAQTEINKVYRVSLAAETHQEILRLHISVDEVLLMN